MKKLSFCLLHSYTSPFKAAAMPELCWESAVLHCWRCCKSAAQLVKTNEDTFSNRPLFWYIHLQADAKSELLGEYRAARGRCCRTLLADAVLEVG
eukprot:1137494-Pelagomonas_calceolata.AAC.6